MTNARHAAVLARVDPGPGYGKVYNYTADAALVPNQDGALITNLGATVVISITFPPAEAGAEFVVSASLTSPIDMVPSGLDFVQFKAPGVSVRVAPGDTVVFGCLTTGSWRVISGNIVPEANGYVDLANFTSVFAEPGESVVYSGADWSSNPPDQGQRRKNWRILMEACLAANGGTGEYDGDGWYTTNETAHRSAGGEVFIRSPLVHEPYADSEYAPFFATADTTQKGATTRGWTFPGGIRITGGVGTIGYNTTSGLLGHVTSRLIGYGAPAAQWYPGAGPVGSGVGRHLSHWRLENIGLARIGDSAVASVANPVLRAANFYDTGLTAITGVVSYWSIDGVVIDLEPSSSYAQVGALIQCGLDCQVPSLRIFGNGNSGWGMVVSGTFNGTAKIQPTTTIKFGDVMCFGSKRGVVFTYANCFMDLFDMEPIGLSTSKQQLILGDQVDSGEIGFLWCEDTYQPDIGTASGADQAVVVIGGIDSEWNPNYGVGTYVKPGPVTIGQAYLSGHSGSAPDYGMMWKSGADTQLGAVTAATFNTAVLRLQPGTVSVPSDPGYLRGSYDSRTAQWGGVANFLSDGTDYAYNGFAAMSGVADRAVGGAGRAPTKPNRSSSLNATAVLGEKVMNTALVAGGPLGWICTTAGAYPTAVYAPFGSSWLEGSATFDPSNLADGAGETTTVTVTGAALGDFAQASFSLDLQGITVTAHVSSANTVSVRFQNETGGAIDLGSGTLRARVTKP